VLLSPGCASFDQYSGYEQRGRCFKDIARALSEEACR
jgi:UDP-N-acetylmuramoylalanine--D-glutamate ligase